MTAPGRLILALADPSVREALRGALPQLEIVEPGDWTVLPKPAAGPQWCFVDWLLPEISGLELCRRLRNWPGTEQAHITLVLEDSEPDTRRRALKAGADDYVPGPLSPQTVVERLGQGRAARLGEARESVLVHGALELDLLAHRAWYAGRPLSLRPKQLALLTYFMRHPDRVHSRAGLLEVLGNGTHTLDDRTVDVCVGRLRRALAATGAPAFLRTVRNLGYVFDSI